MHDVAVLALHGVIAFDLTIPCETFGRLSLPDGYRVRVCGEGPEVRSSAFTIRAPWTLAEAAAADTVVVAGVEDPSLPVPDLAIEVVRTAAARGARVASICTGAFVLAAAGLLDGRRATTHWRAAQLLAARYPAVTVDANVLFVDEGSVLTSAGASAGLDLCLHMVRCDHGQAVAADAARLAVAPLDRAGGQAQFIRQDRPRADTSLAPLLDWMAENLARDFTVAEIAQRSGMTVRTFNRRFREQTGTSPIQWLLDARVRRAQELLETTRQSVEAIAAATGFEAPASFRARFRRTVGVSPAGYRQAFAGGRNEDAPAKSS